MALQKREKKREGVTFLWYGESATGKTPTGLSFPNQLLFDSDGGTKFYEEYNDNILMESNTLVFKEMNDDLDDFESDEELFNQVETINIDSATRYHENMKHAALKVVEQRARKSNRLLEGEGLSFKEYGVMGLHYDRFFAKLLTYVKMGKNLSYVAEASDETESRTDAQGNQISVKVGVKPNLPKGSKFDFDVVVQTYTKDGKSFGKVEKDRTKTFNIGDIVEMPNYNHWKAAIAKAQTGRKITKEEIKNFDETLNAEAESLSNPEGNKVDELISKIDTIIATLSQDQKKELAKGLTDKFKTAKYKDVKDEKTLQAMYEYTKSL
ncbi:AAA family ATPase [Paenibacillus cremeus]|uniref:AAA family ATPase n=1 Tax=Paenibacillus cremeus TaxID=2163881 RepID=A0A559KCN5_9BACL|nr:AAA family ATPase [Paenibacillus cremeus]TVY09885.1 AAA family ATPase [Paenibacillus cremeus]